jgi:HAD superfamily hydrolase (TIGR01509 family)
VIKAIIFDCFGVLIGRGFECTYRLAGGNPVQDRIFIETTLKKANLGLMSDAEFRDTMARQVGISLQDWSRMTHDNEMLNTELLTYIEQLHKSHKTAILSNANRGVLPRILGKRRLQQDFDEVVVSADVGIIKPNERMYQLIIDRLGVAGSECLYIDDRASFLNPARHLDMSVLLYEDFDRIKHRISELLG